MHSIRPICTLIMATLLISGCAAGRTAYSKAQKLEREGDVDAALVKYAQVAAENPDVGEYRVGFLKASETAARAHYKKGEEFLAQKKYDDALREFHTASAIEPAFTHAKQQADLLEKMRAAQTYYQEGLAFEKDRKPREALVAYRHALEFESGNKEVKEALERLVATKKTKLDGYELNLKSTKPITLKFKDAKLKEIFNILTQLSGINFVFDDAVKDVNLSLYLENASFQQAMEIITGMQKLGKKVLNESTIILYPKTPEKFKQYEELFVQTFYLNKLDAKKAVNLVRTMLQVKKIYVNEEMNALVLRDTPEVVEVARKILEANDVPDAEVLLEVEVFELSKKNEEVFGMALSKYAASLGVTTPTAQGGKFLTDALTTTQTVTSGTTTTTTQADTSNLLSFFSYRGFNGYLTVPTATFNFGKTLANGETLSNPKIRVKNREKAKFTVGTREPITTTSSPSGGGVSVNVQYVDVGVKVNAEPTIQLNNEVAIKLGLEVSSILNRRTVGTDQATTVVTIGTRNLDTVLTLRDGETSIIGGLIQKDKTDSKNKVWLLGDIPFLGNLFTNTDNSANKTELMLAITPRIVRGITVPEADVAAFWSGREDEPSSNKPYSSFNQEPEFANATAPAAAPAPAPAKRQTPAPVPAPAQPAPALPAPAAALPGAEAPAVMTPNAVVPAVPAPPVPGAGAPAAPAANAAAVAVAQVPAASAPASTAPSAAISATTPPAASTAPAPGQGSAVAVPGAAALAAVAPVAAAPAAATPAAATPAAATLATPAPAARKPAADGANKMVVSLAAPASVKVDDTFSVQINANGATDLYSSVFLVTYDPKVLDAQTQVEGPFLKQQNTPTRFQSVADKKKGEVWISLSRNSQGLGVVGNGVLASINFKAVGKGTAVIGFSKANFTNPAGLPYAVAPISTPVEVK